ncbi:MAG TPA: YeeE/YedE thiosulfate transporter family protein, partial [Myxococcota bacterium]|nr:YeeE/YedE thiosulfate transporter family protein [Myxococcota bacterium]
RLLFTFMGGVAVAMLGTALLRRRVAVPRRAVHPGSAIGGLLFGVGWVLTGACPSAVGIQLGAGRLPALATLAGVVLGIWIYPRLHARFFRWDAASCGD